MTCQACRKVNLPGGVRCVYCGTHFPVTPDFAFSTEPAGSATSRTPEPLARPQPTIKRGLAGTLAVLAIKAKSLFAFFKMGKILLTFGSMLASMWFYSLLFGYRFAIGFVVCIFVHEMGHIAVNVSKGIKCTAPMFIPFCGAVIFLKAFPDDPALQSESGAGGPAAGLVAAIVCLLMGIATRSPYWYVLAGIGAYVNLFNMLPFPPLDGSHIGTVFSPKTWTFVLLSLLVWALKVGFGDPYGRFTSMVLFIVVVGFLMRMGKSADTRYLLATPAVRLRMAGVFLGLCFALSAIGGISYQRLAGVASGTGQAAHFYAGDEAGSSEVSAPDTEHLATTLGAGALPIYSIVLVLLGFVMWTVTRLLISYAASEQPKARAALLPAGMTLVAMGIGGWAIRVNPLTILAESVAAGYAVATAAALVFSIYAVINRQTLIGTCDTFLVLRALAWATCGMLVTSFSMGSLALLYLWLAIAITVLGLNRWIVPYLLSSIWNSLLKPKPARDWCERALALAPPADAAFRMCVTSVSCSLSMSHGEAALNTLNRLGAFTSHLERKGRLGYLSLRSSALMLMQRFDEALTCIEEMLREPVAGSGPDVRLFHAHLRLAELMRLRRWHNECISQVERALLRTSRTARNAQAQLNLISASAKCGLGDANGARRALDAAISTGVARVARPQLPVVEAELSILESRPEVAVTTLERAYRQSDADIELAYAFAAALATVGRKQEAEARFRQLAAQNPRDYWGIAAAAGLAGA